MRALGIIFSAWNQRYITLSSHTICYPYLLEIDLELLFASSNEVLETIVRFFAFRNSFFIRRIFIFRHLTILVLEALILKALVTHAMDVVRVIVEGSVVVIVVGVVTERSFIDSGGVGVVRVIDGDRILVGKIVSVRTTEPNKEKTKESANTG